MPADPMAETNLSSSMEQGVKHPAGFFRRRGLDTEIREPPRCTATRRTEVRLLTMSAAADPEGRPVLEPVARLQPLSLDQEAQRAELPATHPPAPKRERIIRRPTWSPLPKHGLPSSTPPFPARDLRVAA